MVLNPSFYFPTSEFLLGHHSQPPLLAAWEIAEYLCFRFDDCEIIVSSFKLARTEQNAIAHQTSDLGVGPLGLFLASVFTFWKSGGRFVLPAYIFLT